MNRTRELSLAGRFGRGLDLAPDRPALRVGGESFTYRQLHETALLWGGTLRHALAAPPRAVGVLSAAGAPAYQGILATLYAGATVVPLHPAFPEGRTQQMLRAAGVTALITDEANLASALRLAAGAAAPDESADNGDCPPGIPVVLASSGATADRSTDAGSGDASAIPAGSGPALPAPVPVDPASNAYVLFTSGSTGRPKGVRITQAGLSHYFGLLDDRYDFTPQDVFSQTFDLNFDCAMFDLFSAWGAGGCLVRVPASAYRDLPAYCTAQGLTVWFSTPSTIALVRRMGRLREGSMPTLRWSFFAGEALGCREAVDWQAAADRSVLENLYGPTELTITITAHRWNGEGSQALSVNGGVPIGRLHEGHSALVLDDRDRCVPEGDPGELCIAGPQLTPGYVDPTDGEGRFLERDGLVWYRTGDRVRRTPEGELLYLGRADGQVQVHGWRIELAEIEHAVRGLAGVEQAVAVAAPAGDGLELVVFHTGSAVPATDLVRGLRAVLPDGMIPRRFVHLPELPLNSNRKTDRRALTVRGADLLAGRGEGSSSRAAVG
ncbi:MAG: hypothetical protein QG608_1814 [Actinomycetota bacterium]|nr:hypothetical protein [Actinomycetota bacterium]